ncbi:MAG: HelD family protein [Streptosporangiales bacterium]
MPQAAHVREDELDRERHYLDQARAYLARMRAHVQSLSADAGNEVSQAYLDASLYYYRAEALKDDPETPLFFGRIDVREPEESHHIGRRHVLGERGEPVVLDWRADAARAFYRASAAEPMNLRLRRRYGFTGGTLTAFEDELFEPAAEHANSEILQQEIERPRVGPMRDIVATIQPEQDEIVRGGLATTVCVQGAPGTGKTAVGLHRAAYLLYAFRDRLRRSGTLIVGPNHAFLDYIRAVLPALGELDVRQVTVEELLDTVPVRGAEDARAAGVKGDARMAAVLRRAVRSHVRTPTEGFCLSRGSRRWRIPSYEMEALVTDLQGRDVRYEAARRMLAQRIAHVVLTRMESAGESPDDRIQEQVARSAAVRRLVDDLWPKIDARRVVFRLLSDRAFLAGAAEGVLDADEQAAIAWDRPARGPGSVRWTPADAALVDEAADLIERTPSLGHVVLDEAQDLSPMQLRAVGRRCSTGSATVLGDLAQGTSPWASTSWETALAHLGKPGARVQELTWGYRVPTQIIDFATRLLPRIAPHLAPARSARTSPGALTVRRSEPDDLDRTAADACRAVLAEDGSVGVIAVDTRVRSLHRALDRTGLPHQVLGADGITGERLSVVPASIAKGLEFDHVVVVEPAEILAAGPRGLSLLYVALTRAVSALTVLHAAPLPKPLSR